MFLQLYVLFFLLTILIFLSLGFFSKYCSYLVIITKCLRMMSILFSTDLHLLGWNLLLIDFGSILYIDAIYSTLFYILYFNTCFSWVKSRFLNVRTVWLKIPNSILVLLITDLLYESSKLICMCWIFNSSSSIFES